MRQLQEADDSCRHVHADGADGVAGVVGTTTLDAHKGYRKTEVCIENKGCGHCPKKTSIWIQNHS
jgi:hypothetical protein